MNFRHALSGAFLVVVMGVGCNSGGNAVPVPESQKAPLPGDPAPLQAAATNGGSMPAALPAPPPPPAPPITK